jgi:indole-3-glycerol phosphate synthase
MRAYPMPSAFLTSLLASPERVIMELKPRDGHGRDLLGARRPADVVADFVRAGAPCLSVVTGRWFGGDDRLLGETARIAGVPILKKDFITTDAQIAAAKSIGASAVLLTARILPRSILQRRIRAALREGLTPFVEVTSESELERVVHAEECAIAISNKDIAGRERDVPDLGRSLALLDAVRATGTPCPVSASGIDDPADAARLLDAGFEAVLVGTALLRTASVQRWVDELRRQRCPARAVET